MPPLSLGLFLTPLAPTAAVVSDELDVIRGHQLALREPARIAAQ